MKLFIDDERFPPDSESNVHFIVRTFDEAIEFMTTYGCPDFISFDHDLGENEKTGFDIAKWICDHDLDNNCQFMPNDFKFEIHSQNPVGYKNIKGLLEQYIKIKKENNE